MSAAMEGFEEIMEGVKKEQEDQTATGSSPAVSAQPGSPAPSTGGKSSDSPASIIASGTSGCGSKAKAKAGGNSKRQKKSLPCKICGQLFGEMPSGLPT